MTCGLDTSVVVRLLVGEPKAQADRAWQHLSDCRTARKPAHVSALVVADVFFVLQHHYGVPADSALQQLAAVLSDASVSVEPAVLAVLRAPDLATAKPGFVDRLIHATYGAQGHELVTFDKLAARLPGARLLKLAS